MSKKNIISAIVFILLAALTFYVIFKGNDMEAVVESVRTLHPLYLCAAVATAFFFVSAEGFMICYLLRSLNYKTSAATCVKYSFVGFFFSGITPSATGGQPMQLYYMQKEGHKVSDSSVVLMTVAVIYKFVLVVMGIGILIFCYKPLADHLQGYLYLYYLGLFLNTLLVVVLLFIMVSPKCFKGIVVGGEKLLKKLRILKNSGERTKKLIEMADQYHEAVLFFLAVDMLPLPGAQGITEMMYKTAFSQVFTGATLTASMCVTRGLNFYIVLIVSALVAAWCHFKSKVGHAMSGTRTTLESPKC